MVEDQETERAIAALVYRLRDRGEADVEVVARTFMAELRGHGWRPTEARTPWDFRNLPAGAGLPASEDTRRGVEEARHAAAEASARHAAAEASARQRAASRQAGDAA